MRRLIQGLADVVFGEDPCCMVCGRDAVHMAFGLCEDCLAAFPFAEQPLISQVLSVCRYEPPVKQLIYDYKYNDQRYIGRYMAELMAALIKQRGLSYDLILTVPGSSQRKKTRGFDHTLYMAQILSDNLGIDWGDQYLVRVKETQRLKGLSKAERLIELDQVFELRCGDELRGKRLLLIDDILTTGATLSACTEVLSASGPESVQWLTFAVVA